MGVGKFPTTAWGISPRAIEGYYPTKRRESPDRLKPTLQVASMGYVSETPKGGGASREAREARLQPCPRSGTGGFIYGPYSRTEVLGGMVPARHVYGSETEWKALFNNGEQAWERSDLFTEITDANVADIRADRQRAVIEITVYHPDLSEGISIGHVYLRGSLEGVFTEVDKILSALVGGMEAGVPEARRTALPLARVWGSLYRARVGLANVVRGGWQW